MKDKNRRGNNRRRNNRRREEIPRIQYPTMDCAICGETIKDVSNAIATGEEGRPAHFDCILRQLSAQEDLASGERIIYLGSGNFGVIAPSNEDHVPFTIVRKLPIEEFKELPEWRREIKFQLKR
jgi:hypothetical protein